MEQMRNLIPLNVKGAGNFIQFSEPASLYCSPSVPTLYLSKIDRLFEIAVIDNLHNYDELDQELAIAVHNAYCRE